MKLGTLCSKFVDSLEMFDSGIEDLTTHDEAENGNGNGKD